MVNICSPVKTAFAPAMKHIACSDSESVCRPAARRIIVEGRTIRAVAIVRIKVCEETGSLPSMGVPGIGTRALTGKDSGCSDMLFGEIIHC